MWCADFDADLLKVVPGAAEALGPAGSIQLQTFSRLTDGAINCPSAWNTDHGLASFFWTAPEFRPAACFVTGDPVSDCTFLEVVRDEWVHSCVVCVNGVVVWRPPARLMERLMYGLRGWTPLEDAEREAIRSDVLRSLRRAAERLAAVTQAGELAAGWPDPWLDRDPREDERGGGTVPCR
jgi:hypothetical protein